METGNGIDPAAGVKDTPLKAMVNEQFVVSNSACLADKQRLFLHAWFSCGSFFNSDPNIDPKILQSLLLGPPISTPKLGNPHVSVELRSETAVADQEHLIELNCLAPRLFP